MVIRRSLHQIVFKQYCLLRDNFVPKLNKKKLFSAAVTNCADNLRNDLQCEGLNSRVAPTSEKTCAKRTILPEFEMSWSFFYKSYVYEQF